MPEFWLLELVLVQVLALSAVLVQALGPVVLKSRKLEVQALALAATLVQALGPVVLESRNVKLMRVVL